MSKDATTRRGALGALSGMAALSGAALSGAALVGTRVRAEQAADEWKPAAHGSKPAAHGSEPAAHGSAPAAHGSAPAAHGEPAGPGMTPDEALALLKQGNTDYVMEAPYRGAGSRERRLEIAAAQHPFAVLVGCSDSRVSPELLFGRGLGELFIIRVAGNTVDLAALGSVEYALAELAVPLVVVLGHERCGAVKAALAVVEENATFPGRIGDMVEPIIPAVLQSRELPGDPLDNAVRANVERVVGQLKTSGPVITGLIEEGRVKIVGARYDLEDGVVEFMETS